MITDIEFNNLKQILADYAKAVEIQYKAKLRSDNRVASGNLLSSISTDVKILDTIITVNVNMADYWEQIENGRRPTQNGGNGVVYDKIIQWIQHKGIVPHPSSNGKVPSTEQLAYMITRHIHKYGYMGGDKSSARGYLELTLEELNSFYEARIRQAVEQDVEIYIYKDINNQLTLM